MSIVTKRILGWIAFGVGLLIMTFFRKYNSDVIPYPWVFYVSGIICFFVGFFLIRKTPTLEQNKIHEKAQSFVKNLKEKGDKLTIELDNCEIKENHYYQEQDSYKGATDLELLTANDLVYLYNKINFQASDNQVYQSIVICKAFYKGQDLTFHSPVIPKDKDNLLFKFGAQKRATIYIDKSDPDKYYFDIEFVYQ